MLKVKHVVAVANLEGSGRTEALAVLLAPHFLVRLLMAFVNLLLLVRTLALARFLVKRLLLGAFRTLTQVATAIAGSVVLQADVQAADVAPGVVQDVAVSCRDL